uniref:Cell-membrane associated Mucin15 n=1 Tax=Siphoviridae sp. ctDmQ3 TaxID=2823570 RepID=A0A8S5L831_9CAUD|nr:MAG TPA: Cell-membrane associated Mucin15 [Siphoviridae sp. ctDmQ3]
MLGMKGIYRINPALLGGICGGITGIILYGLYLLLCWKS